MGRGLLIDYNDGSPRMEITAGLRCPSFAGQTANVPQGGGVVSVAKTSGSTMFMLPSNTTTVTYRPNFLVPDIAMLTGFVDNGNGTVTQTDWGTDPKRRPWTYAATFVEILAISQSGNRGLLIQDSTDFTAIPLTQNFMGCVWYGNFTVSGRTPLPVSGVPFGSWDAAGVSLAFDGTNLMAFQVGDQYGDIPATITIRLAIFATKQPVPGRGLTFVNATGQVTFSTTSKPFVFLNEYWNPAAGAKNIAGKMVMICKTGFRSKANSGWDSLKDKGIVMSGSAVYTASNATAAVWTAQYTIDNEQTLNFNIPLIPAFY